MKRKTFVLALGLLLMSTPCVFAQNKGKQVGKAVEAAVTKKVPKVPRIISKASTVPAVKTPASPTAPRVPTVRSMAPVSAAGTQVAPRLNAAQLGPKLQAPRAAADLTPAHVEVAENNGGLTFVPVQQFAVEFLAEQAEKERLKVREISQKVTPRVIVDGHYADTGEPYVEEAKPSPEEYEAYRQAVRDALQARKARVEEFGGEDGFHAYREKTYGSALELAEDVALFSSLVPEVSIPPCFMDLVGGRISYVIEIPTAGIVIEKDGVREVLDPQTQVILFQPNPIAEGGKGAYITQRSALENPSMYIWLSGGRPEGKFVVEQDIPAGVGFTEGQWQAVKQQLRERVREKLQK